MARRKRSRKSSSKRSRRASRKVVHIFKANPNPKRRRARRSSVKRSRRRYRRNPALTSFLPSTGFVKDAAFVTAGFIGNKMLANMVLPMIGVQQPMFRIGSKVVLAGVLGWAGKAVLGASAGQYLALGGMVEAVNDAVQTYVTPMFPALSVSSYPELSYYGNEMSAYPGLSSYAELDGLVHDDVREQV